MLFFLTTIFVSFYPNSHTYAADPSDGIYLDGSNGNDSRSGLNKNNAVKTFNKALELLQARSDKKVIYICGVVQVTGNEEWISPFVDEPVTVLRYDSFYSNFVNITGSLKLNNIVFDGRKDTALQGKTMFSLINVRPGGKIEIGGDLTELKNNNATMVFSSAMDSYAIHGGAICCLGGTIIMTGGSIHDNVAGLGGGIFIGKQSASNPTPIFDMSGGKIYNNKTVTLNVPGTKYYRGEYYAGGGVMLSTKAIMRMHGDAEISNNQSYWGGGISQGNLEYNSNSISWNNSEFYMFQDEGSNKLPKITGNTASRGGGLFVQGMNYATITAGEITNNQAFGSSGYPEGGGIYVNGDHRTNMHSGELRLYNVEMTGNQAARAGGAIMTCASSITNIRDDLGAVIYDNTNSQNNAQVAYTTVDTYGDVGTRRGSSTLSKYVLGGGEYNWTNSSSVLLDDATLYASKLQLLAFTDLNAGDDAIQKGKSLARVFINNNIANNSGGGAIGNNGVVYIGTYLQVVDVVVNKQWENDDSSKRPAAIKVILKQDGIDYDSAIVEADQNGVWPNVEFKDLPKYKLNSDGTESNNPHVYTIEEDSNYSISIKRYDISITSKDTTTRYGETTNPDKASVLNAVFDSSTNTYKYSVDVYNFLLTNKLKTINPIKSGKIVVSKTINGDETTNVPEFKFELKRDNSSYPMVDGITDDTTTLSVSGAGNVEFPSITFNEPGTYTYTIKELAPSTPLTNWTYDSSYYQLIYNVELNNTDLTISKTIKHFNNNGELLKQADDLELLFTNTYTAERFTITYDLNGGTYNGSSEPIKETYIEGKTIEIHDAPEKEGYIFSHWQGSKYQPKDKYTVSENHTFVAQWTNENVVKTGDNNNLVFYILLFIGSISTATFLIKENKKIKE